jgi:hypothetical protein
MGVVAKICTQEYNRTHLQEILNPPLMYLHPRKASMPVLKKINIVVSIVFTSMGAHPGDHSNTKNL